MRRGKMLIIFIALMLFALLPKVLWALAVATSIDVKITKVECKSFRDRCKLEVKVFLNWGLTIDPHLGEKRRDQAEEYFRRNIPILWIYKDGVKEEVTLNQLDPYKASLSDFGGRYLTYTSNFSFAKGEHHHIKVIADPLSLIPEGHYYGEEMQKNYEDNNFFEADLGCEDFEVVKKACPSGYLIFPGSRLSASGTVSNYYNDIHTVILPLIISQDTSLRRGGPQFIETSFGEDHSIGHIVLDIQAQSRRDFTVTGVIPQDTPPGRYYLGVAVLNPLTDEEANTQNNIFWCPIRVQPTAQQLVGEMAKKGQVPETPGVQRARKLALASLPDLTVASIKEIKDCSGVEITVKNLGAPLQDSVYQSNPVLLKVVEDYYGVRRTLASFTLNQADPRKVLKETNGEVTIRWRIPAGVSLTHPLIFTVDPNRAILESNEGNNAVRGKIVCTQGSEKKFHKRPPVMHRGLIKK